MIAGFAPERIRNPDHRRDRVGLVQRPDDAANHGGRDQRARRVMNKDLVRLVLGRNGFQSAAHGILPGRAAGNRLCRDQIPRGSVVKRSVFTAYHHEDRVAGKM